MKGYRNKIIILPVLTITLCLVAGCRSTNVNSTPVKIIVPTQTAPSGIQSVSDNLDLIIAELEKNMPRAKTEGFITPKESEEFAFHKIVLAIEEGDPESAIDATLTHNYEIIKFSDQENSDAEGYILREQIPITKGWGMYIFNEKSTQNIIVEAPHPLADEYTPKVALDIFRALNARALLISGTHRDANRDESADNAHAPKSIFQSVHLTLFQYPQQFNQDAVFLQIHGFAAKNHPHYPPVVIGYNWKDDPEKDRLLQNIEEALQSNDIQVGICDGKKYQDLCGTSNIQSSTTEGGTFIHIEVNKSLRKDDGFLVESLKQAIKKYLREVEK